MLVRLGRGTDGDGVSFVRVSTLHNNFVYMHQEKEVTERDVKEKKVTCVWFSCHKVRDSNTDAKTEDII